LYPVLLHVGGFTLYSYGVFAALAFLTAGYVVNRLLGRLGLDPGLAVDLVVAAGLGGLAGARLYWMAEHWQDVRGDWAHALGGSGFTWYGGLIGGVLAVILIARVRRIPLGVVANVMAPAVAVGYAVGRIACQLSGDGNYGRASDLPWAMSYPNGMVPTTVRVQPTPVYETLVMLLVFVILYRMARSRRPGWYVFGWFLVLSGIERFGIEFLRINAKWLLGLTPPQWFAMASIVIGAAVVVRLRIRPGELVPRLSQPAKSARPRGRRVNVA
jgi:phosphatidylglycerol:prolipoprotein diacylglycerol transferase